jgi:hypothetical protein
MTTTATVVPIRREFQVHRFDPIKHGVLSRHIALPWEDRAAFEEILRGLLVEHQPQGPTAYHLVEDLAGVIWRKRRLLQAEGAAIRERLFNVATGFNHEKVARYALAHKGEKFHADVGDVIAGRLPKLETAARDLEKIERALAAVRNGNRGGYQAALRLLDEETLEAWEAEAVDEADLDAGGYTRDANGLTEFLESSHDWLKAAIKDAANVSDVTDQVHGMAVGIRDLERIARIEAHLDSKLQRLLTLLRDSKKARPSVTG